MVDIQSVTAEIKRGIKEERTRMWADANVMVARPNIGGLLCESSVIPFLVPRREVWLTPTTQVPCSSPRSQSLSCWQLTLPVSD